MRLLPHQGRFPINRSLKNRGPEEILEMAIQGVRSKQGERTNVPYLTAQALTPARWAGMRTAMELD
jgi:hypothetical protein